MLHRRAREEAVGKSEVDRSEPDFVTPWHIREAAIFALERGKTYYTSNLGLIELRRATVFGPSSPSPCASDRRQLAATNPPSVVGRPFKSTVRHDAGWSMVRQRRHPNLY